MPQKAGTACRRPGCPGIVNDGTCSHCGPLKRRRDREVDERRGDSRDRGYDSRWDRLRTIYMREHPLCERCESEGRVTMAQLVHHKRPLVDGGELLDMDNLQAVCRACHGVIHAELDVNRRLGVVGAVIS